MLGLQTQTSHSVNAFSCKAQTPDPHSFPSRPFFFLESFRVRCKVEPRGHAPTAEALHSTAAERFGPR